LVARANDDIIAIGGSRRRAERDETVEDLFRAHYPRLVHRAFALLGDRDLAEQVSTQAYLSLWRHWGRVGGPREAPAYLYETVARLASSKLVKGGGQHSAEPELTVPEPDQAVTDEPAVDTARAWRELQELRARWRARYRRLTAGMALAAVATVAIAVPLLTSDHSVRRTPPRTGQSGNFPGSPRDYQRAIVARLPLTGVISVAGSAARAWAVRAVPQPSTIEQPGVATSYQLVAIDLRNNTITYRVNLGHKPRAVAAGAGRVWLTTALRQAGGQIVRIDPASGRVVQVLHLHAGRCTELSFGSGHLYAACTAWPTGTGLWALNPVSGRSFLLGSPVRGFISSLIAAPEALWYVLNYSRITGLAQFSGRTLAVRPQHVTAHVPGQTPNSAWWSLAYDSGSIWILGGEARVARINAVTGKLVQLFTYRTLDPAQAGGLNYLTAGSGSLWFLDNGYPFGGVLRVSEVTGRPRGGVAIAPNACGQQVCSLIFYTPGSVWVPAALQLIRIDPGRLPR
jgi:DNA-directed RNA polymerase specialized sigma24 family protein